MARARSLIPLGAAIAQRDAQLRSGWEHDYAGALDDAKAGKIARLIDLLRAHRPLGEADFDGLADYVEATAKRFHRQRNVRVHRAANLAEAILTVAPRSRSGRVSDQIRAKAIEVACAQVAREINSPIDEEAVRDLLRRPPSRRR
jgi:hypothetical protein